MLFLTREFIRRDSIDNNVTVPLTGRRLEVSDSAVVVAHAGERPVAGGPLGVAGGGKGLGHYLEQLRRQKGGMGGKGGKELSASKD